MYKLAEVIAAFTLTHVRHNRHMQYLSSAPNFRGGQLPPPWLGLPESPMFGILMECSSLCLLY